MPLILARINPRLEAIHDEILAVMPELAGIANKFDTLSCVEKREFITAAENDSSTSYLAFFLKFVQHEPSRPGPSRMLVHRSWFLMML